MTTLAELTADVFSITNRPDLVGETELAVRNATLKMHRTDFYFKDLFETGIQFSTGEYLQTLEYKTLLPKWRALKYLRKYDAVHDCPGQVLDIITVDEVFDSYHGTRVNTVYAAGSNLQIRSSSKEVYYLLGAYLFPDVTATGYSSWIADEQSSAIVYEAASFIFKAIGYDEQNALYKQLVLEEIALLKLNNISAQGS